MQLRQIGFILLMSGLVLAGFSLSPRISGEAKPVDDVFYVTGKVHHPGQYPLAVGQTVAQGIEQAGGLTIPEDSVEIVAIRAIDGKTIRLAVAASDRVLADDVLDVHPRLNRGG